jgi:hypothetical protein
MANNLIAAGNDENFSIGSDDGPLPARNRNTGGL